MTRQVPRAQVVEKTVGIPQFQIVQKTVEAPQLQIGAQTSESLGSAPVRQVAQVSTTGVVKPDDPDAGIKFFAAEALHGVHGNRLANESGRRGLCDGRDVEERLCDGRDVEEETSIPSSLVTGRLLMKLPRIASITLKAESGRSGGARLEDAGFE